MPSQVEKYQTFRALHEQENAFVMPNPWNTGTSRLLTQLGFKALATTSAGLAISLGLRDSAANLTRGQILANAGAIVRATSLPVSADLENGFGASPEACAETIKLAAGTGLVGGSIEDATGDPENPLYEFEAAVERIHAAVESKKNLPFLLTARTENFLWGRPDLDETIRRLQAFADAGADVVYAPGLPDIQSIETLCREVNKPVNVVMGLGSVHYSVDALSKAGVKRISVGGSFARTALAALKRAAAEALNQGTFTYSETALTGSEAERLTGTSSLSHSQDQASIKIIQDDYS